MKKLVILSFLAIVCLTGMSFKTEEKPLVSPKTEVQPTYFADQQAELYKVGPFIPSSVTIKVSNNIFVPVSLLSDPCDGQDPMWCYCVTSVTSDDCVGGSQLQQTRQECSHAQGYPTVYWTVFYVSYTWLQVSC
jgi:hypothetical protein